MDLIRKIEAWSAATPSRPAHVSAKDVLTYGQLQQRSDQFASHLLRALPSDKSAVAILGHKQSEMLVGFLGSLKAGHPYVPLDSSLPASRVQAILQAAGASLFSVEQIREVCSRIPAATGFEPRWPSREDIWYVIFTSGSTGEPKGVMITRDSLESFVSWTLDEQRFTASSEVFLNQAPFSFDLSVMDLYSSLVTGGTLFSLTQELLAEPRRLYESLGSSGITVWVSTPSFARLCLMQPTFGEAMLPDVRKFWFCGETLAPEVAAELLRRFPRAEVWNTYGPTEATVATTSVMVTNAVLDRYNPLPVGRAKPGSTLMIQDDAGHLLEPGSRGEIVIAGPNVSLGYINRPDLTARAFFEHEGHRAYRTGDAGHWDGDLLFFDGRLDFQIKLHGYRIELGDIEANIHKLQNVQDAVVLPVMRDDRPEYLVAFAIMRSMGLSTEFELSQQLRGELGARLPDYMIPRRFVFVREFPITPNGKVDRQKLAQTIP